MHMAQNWKGTNGYLPSCPPANTFTGQEELLVSQEALTSYSTHLQTDICGFFNFVHTPTVPLLFIHLPAHLRVLSLYMDLLLFLTAAK